MCNSIVMLGIPKKPNDISFIICIYISGWLGAMSTSVSLFLSPLVIGLCRRKSTRLTAVMGGLITALGCLFTSFASQFHQLFFSYGMMIGKAKICMFMSVTRLCNVTMCCFCLLSLIYKNANFIQAMLL